MNIKEKKAIMQLTKDVKKLAHKATMKSKKVKKLAEKAKKRAGIVARKI